MNILENSEIAMFENRICQHEAYVNAYQSINKLIDYQGRKPKGMLLSGTVGSGKTCLAKTFGEKELPDSYVGSTKVKPMVYINVSLYRSPNQVLSAILEEMGDINPFKGNLEQKLFRVIELFEKLGVKLLVIDEFHDLLPKSDILPSSAVYRFLKGFLDTCGVPFLLIGLYGTERIFNVDKQLTSRFLPTQYLHEFNCLNTNEMIRFALVIESLLEHFPRKTKGLKFVESTLLDDGSESFGLIKDHNLLLRFTLATGGLMRLIMNLLTECIEITGPNDVVDKSVLEKAYSNVIHSDLNANPFNASVCSLSRVKTLLAKEGLYNVN